MANIINSINFNDDNIYTFSLPYGVCSTAADTVAKEVTVDNFSLEEGATVIVKFTYANSIASPTLNVNGTGAKPIYRYETTAASTDTSTTGWRAGAVQLFVYDGTGWIRDFWENTTYSNVGLGQGYATCPTAAATVAKTVSLSSYALSTGGIVSIRFTNGNTVSSPTLNINSKGAKSIYYNGAALTDTTMIEAGDIVTFIYSSQYHIISINKAGVGGTGISVDGYTINHSNSVTAGSVGSAQSPSHGGTFAIPKITYDAQGHITAASTVNVTLPTASDTKNTAGSTNSSSKLFIIGATSQAANPQTYSHDTAYIGTDGCLYSNNTKVSVDGHTHSYAGSSTAGGSATSAVKLDSSAGSATQPVYFSSGKPVACTYTLAKSVPSNAVFTDTTYSEATSSTAGLLSSSDKAKLDTIASSADAVSFSQSLTSGTKVGTITINGTDTILYAPTNTDTHYTTGLIVGASSTATSNAAASNGSVYLNVLDNTTVRASHKITGSGATTVTSDANGVITISSTNTAYTLSSFGITATAAELNILDGVTATTKEINYLSGVTSEIQDQLNGKAASSHGTHVTFSSTAPAMNGTAAVGSATTVSRSDHVHPTDTSRAAASHNHSASNITSGTLSVSRGGTGTTTFTSGQVLIGNGTDAIATRAIDTTTGGTSGSTSLITSGAVYSGLATKAASSHTHSYLPLSGGTLTTSAFYGLTVKRSDANGSAISFANSKTTLGGAGFLSTSTFAVSSGTTTAGNIFLADTTSATFPGIVTATRFIGALFGNATSASKVNNALSVFVVTSPSETTSSYTYDGSAAKSIIVTDTKNTAGSSNSSSKLFLVGATSQTTSSVTYSHDTVYVGTDGHLYSDSKQVVNLSGTQALTNKTYNGYTLAAACAKTYVDSSSASAISTGTSLVTERDVYYGLPKINGVKTYTSNTNIYAPTSAGTNGQMLVSSGSTPTWKNVSDTILDLVYPVGSIYISTANVNPSTFIGGSWEAFGTGRTLVGVDPDDDSFSTSELTGGEKYHTLTLSEIPSHSHTVNSHTHAISITSGNNSVGHTHSVSGTSGTVSSDHTHTYSGNTGAVSANHTHSFSASATTTTNKHRHNAPHNLASFSGSGTAYAHLYNANNGTTAKYTNRYTGYNEHSHTVSVSGSTGGISANHSHGFSGTTSGISANHSHTISFTSGGISANHTHTVSGTSGAATPATDSKGGSSSHNNMQPYITVYMWKRIASIDIEESLDPTIPLG